MFTDLYDYISQLFSWRWPKAEGAITAVYLGGSGSHDQAMVAYEFSVDGDGPFTGESRWYGDTVFVDGLVGQKVTVLYRKDNPSVNRLDDPAGF